MTVTQEEAAAKAAVLIQSLPWLKRFRGQMIVIKFGGNAMVDESLTSAFAEDMVYLRYVGIRPVVVHGGGPQITAELEPARHPSEFRGGYRERRPMSHLTASGRSSPTQVGAGLVERSTSTVRTGRGSFRG